MAAGTNTRIVGRNEALRRGEMFYFTGKACPQGHVCPRYVTSYSCRDCNTNGNGHPPKRTREERLAYMREWHVQHREERLEKQRLYYQANKHKWPTYEQQGPDRVK